MKSNGKYVVKMLGRWMVGVVLAAVSAITIIALGVALGVKLAGG